MGRVMHGVDWPKSSHRLLLWFTAITGCHTSRKTSYNQWLVTDKQETHYQARVSQGERKPSQTEDTWDHSSSYVNTIFIVLCMSNCLMCAYITDIYDKRWSHHARRDIYCKQSEFSNYYLHSILSADYFAIMYVTDNL